jgi:cell division protein FtsL
MNRKIKKNSFKPKIIGVWIILMSFFIAEFFFYAWCRVQCVNIGYDISKEEIHRQRYHTLQNTLKIELAHLKSPERIAEIAKERLGLKTPVPEQIIIIP